MRKRPPHRAARSRSLDQALGEAQRQADYWTERVEILRRAKRVVDEDLAALASRAAGVSRTAFLRERERREHPKKNKIDPNSHVGQTVAVLRDFRTPTHIEKILNEIETRTGKRLNKHGIVGSISQYVRDRRIFYRPEPNTFGLVEWQNGKGSN